jgi:hypothetical protein
MSLAADHHMYDLGDSNGDGDEYSQPYRPEDCYSPGVYLHGPPGPGGNVNHDYAFFSGSSTASPAAAGVCALIRQYYTQMENITPSGILMKASLIHGGIDMSYGFPSNDQGWGRVNVKESLFPDARATVQYYDHRTGISSGTTWDADVDGGLDTVIQSNRAPLKVTMVTLDTSGNGGRLSNDLDLRVTSPSATVYRGNNFVGAWSVSGGTDDDQMLVERVLIEEPEAGSWTIQVNGETAPVGNTPFAIVISGDFGPEKEYMVQMTPEVNTQFNCVAGGSTTFKFNLLNFGTQDDTIALSENNLPAGFTVTYAPTSPIDLLSNEDTDVTVIIDVDITVPPEAYEFDFIGTSQNDPAIPPAQDKIEVTCYVIEFAVPEKIRCTTSLASEGSPTIATHNDGTDDYLFITYLKYDENGPHVYLRYSSDYGNSWTERQVSTVNDGPIDPRIVVYPHNSPNYPDRVVILWHGSDPAGGGPNSWVYCAYANPPYNIWTGQQVVATSSGTPDPFNDHRRVAAEIYMGGTGSEELIVTIECLGSSNTIDICDVYSTTGGVTWSGWGATKPAATANPDFLQEMTSDQNGDVYMVNYRSEGGTVRRQIYLTNYNGGGTWSAQQAITTLNTNWNDVFPTIWASDEGSFNNRLYVAKLYTTQDPPDPPFTIYVSHSDDSGATWSPASGPYGSSASQSGYSSGRPLMMGAFTPTDSRNWLTREEEPTGGAGENPYPVPNIHTQFTSNGFSTDGLFKVTTDAMGKEHPTFAAIGNSIYHVFAAQYEPGNKDIWMVIYNYSSLLPDLIGPIVYNIDITPNPPVIPNPALLTAVIDDTFTGFSEIQAAEYDMGPAPYLFPNWPGTPMTPSDGSFNSAIECVESLIDTSTLMLGDYTIWIHGQDSEGNWGQDKSFTFSVDYIPPYPWVQVVSPNGGEAWIGGSSHDILWEMGDNAYPITDLVADIYYSTTGPGGPWIPITTVVGVTSYNWNPVPAVDSNNCYIMINVTDPAMLVATDTSNSSFTIDSTPPEPATNARAELDGTCVRIYWDASVSTDVDQYEVYWAMNSWDPSGDSYANMIFAGLNTDCYHSNVGVNNPQTYYYQVRTYDLAGHEVRTAIQAVKIGSTQSIFANPSGWFLMGLSLQVSNNSVEYLLKGQGLPGNCDHIMLHRGGQWLHWAPYWPPSLNTLTYILTGESFWMHFTGNSRWCVAGRVLDYVVPFDAGWTLVAYPFAQRFKTSGEIMSHLAANCPDYDQMLIANHTQPYRIAIPSGTENIYDYQGFWIHVTADTAWTVTNY